MKKLCLLLAIVLLATGSVFAEQSVLIDFTKLSPDADGQNTATLMDFGATIGTGYTDAQKALMKSSLAYENWDVRFNPSADRKENFGSSEVKAATSTVNGTVMGARIHFPVEPWDATANVVPPFDIPAFQSATGESGAASAAGTSKFENGFGVIKNVQTVKQIQVNVYGLNFPHALYIVLKDSSNVEKEYFMGYLDFNGWRALVWDNPAYIENVKNRSLALYPLYPQDTPYIKFVGFRVKRDASAIGGDFVAYFKDVSVIYDKAVETTTRDIDDEAIWGIQTERENNNMKVEFQKLGSSTVLQEIEKEKQATESFTTDTTGTAAGGGAAAPAPAAGGAAAPAPAAGGGAAAPAAPAQ
ncbi:MAG: flagellar filament outer layer protein FlaA [Spirochaetaceae bacterium]|jgi:hypothetical protein|nr:flagellar filament outer layer protein FlaA [Spirochaetaceae bacterium]